MIQAEIVQGVRDAMSNSVAIAWDGCHKIYILNDWQQHDQMKEYGYEHLVTIYDKTREELVIETLQWLDNSCSLRFINLVATEPDGTDRFETILGQFEEVYA